MHSPHLHVPSRPLPYHHPTTPPTATPSNAPSSSLSHYAVICPIGSGTFGHVSLIRRLSDSTLLVWKELSYGGMTEKEKGQLVSEVNILRELNHRHVVKYYDRIIDRSHRKIYIVMEYWSALHPPPHSLPHGDNGD